MNIVLRPAVSYALAKAMPFMLFSLLFLGLAWLLLPAFILISVFFAGAGFYRFLRVRATCYYLGEEVLQTVQGIFFKRTDRLELFRVKDYIVTQNLFMRVWGLMNVELLTTDLSAPVTLLRGIPRSDLTDRIRERVQLARQRNKIVELN